MPEGHNNREPHPGRLASLGEDVDHEDAEDLLGVLKAMATHQSRGRLAMNKAAREALWWIWEQRRLPRPLIRGKYPASYPWSPGATAALNRVRDAGLPDGRLSGVIIEHLMPARLTMDEALAGARGLDVDGMLNLLRQHGAAAIMTREEGSLLSAAGLSSRMPSDWDGVDPWARPRTAGLDPALFRSIEMSRGVLDRTGHVEIGHAKSKVDLAWLLAEKIEQATGWSRTTTTNQITFRDGAAIPVRVQFWGNRVRLEWGVPTDRATNPLAPIEILQGKSGRCYWFFGSADDRPVDIEPVLALVGWRPDLA